mmetsp:Transcript_1858/g.216  ORF Transcript_1858/g.216 Transcript_1858/m.216 type:complete len:91 (-) Transcript_1858:837-1109(-)
MSENHTRERSRSRSPKQSVQGTKLHISNLPLDYVNSDLERIFSPYGKIEDIRIIRKGSNGQPLRETCYGFVLMSNEREAKAAMAKLNELG